MTPWAYSTSGRIRGMGQATRRGHLRDEPDWMRAIVGIPAPKDHINIRIDHDVLEWFRSNGKGYQTLINNVLKAFVQTRQQRGSTK